jgi:hypothetical protein
MEPVHMKVKKIADDRYHVSADENFIRVDEDVDGSKLMGMTGLTTQELFYQFDMKPIGHEVTILSR